MKSFSHRFISNPRLAWVIAIGICTCAGMLASAFVGILFVPALYCIVERIREALTGKRGPKCVR